MGTIIPSDASTICCAPAGGSRGRNRRPGVPNTAADGQPVLVRVAL